MIRLISALLLSFILALPALADDPNPTQDDLKTDAALAVARMYGLTRSQAILLLSIRDHEKGRPGLEFGIKNIPCEFHDGCKSLLINAARACETIKRRCPDPMAPGAIKRLNKRWAKDPQWWICVQRNMKKNRDIIY